MNCISKNSFIILIALLTVCNQTFAQNTLPEITKELLKSLESNPELSLVRKGLLLAENERNDSTKAEFYVTAAICYGIKSKSDSALLYFDKTLAIKNVTSPYIRARAYNGKGNVERKSGNDDASLSDFLSALEELKNETDKRSKIFIASITTNISSIYFNQKDLEKAEYYSLKGLKLAEEMENKNQVAYCYVGLALIYNNSGNYDKALDYHQKATRMIEEDNILYLKSFNQINLAKLYQNRKEPKKALEIYLALTTEQDINMDVATTALTNAMKIQQEAGNHEAVIDLANKLLTNAQKASLLPSVVDAHRLMAKSYEVLGDFKQANYHLNQFIVSNDSIVSTESKKAFSEIETKYETGLKEKKIIELELQNQASVNERNLFLFISLFILVIVISLFLLVRSKTRNNKIISETLAEKELLLREIHHRVKNNLQVISSLLSLQSRHITDDVAKAAVNEGQNRVKSMALIHQKLYQSDNISGVEAKEYIQSLTDTLKSSYSIEEEQVEINYDLQDINIDVDTIIPIGLIMNELISNVFKHAFPNGSKGALEIRLKEVNNKLELNVKDNGVGAGGALQKSASFGIRMIRSLAMKLEAEVNFNFDKGTEATLSISNYKLVK